MFCGFYFLHYPFDTVINILYYHNRGQINKGDCIQLKGLLLISSTTSHWSLLLGLEQYQNVEFNILLASEERPKGSYIVFQIQFLKYPD